MRALIKLAGVTLGKRYGNTRYNHTMHESPHKVGWRKMGKRYGNTRYNHTMHESPHKVGSRNSWGKGMVTLDTTTPCMRALIKLAGVTLEEKVW